MRPNANVLFLVLLALLLMGALGQAFWGDRVSTWSARVMFCMVCVLGMRIFSIREHVLLVVACISAGAAWRATGSVAPLVSALDLAAFFGAFIAALTVMRDIAARSRSVLAVGRFLTGQPAGRRYWATALGGHALGVFLNFGAISLLAPLIQESARDRSGAIDPQIERRQISTLIRGFAWVLLWAPTMLAQAVLLTIFPEVTWREIAPVGCLSALGFIGLGRLYDRYEWRSVPSSYYHAATLPHREFIVVLSICSLLIGATIICSQVADTSVALALMLVAPLVTVGWFTAQTVTRAQDAPRAQFLEILKPSAPSLARSAVALGLSGFIGRVVGQALPVDALAVALDKVHFPGWLFLAALPVVISLAGQIALSPILMVVLIGEVLAGITNLPTGQPQILFALSVGWALSMMISPNATATLLISATTNIAPTMLTWRWNLRYGLLCYGVAVLIFVLIA